MPKGGLTTSIERLDMNNLERGWKIIEFPVGSNHMTKPRQLPGVLQFNSQEILILGGFSISSALKGLFQSEAGGMDGLSDIYSFNLSRKTLHRLTSDQDQTSDSFSDSAYKLNPWHFVSRSMQPGTAITFNHDTNEVVEVTFHALASPVCTPVANLSYLMWVKTHRDRLFLHFSRQNQTYLSKTSWYRRASIFNLLPISSWIWTNSQYLKSIKLK